MKRPMRILAAVMIVVAVVSVLVRRSDAARTAAIPTERLESQIEACTGMENVSLTADGEGRYAGYGVAAGGRTVQIQTSRKGDKIEWRAFSSGGGGIQECGGGEFLVEAIARTSSRKPR